ncbi:MAG TPA: translocation/assembly module TamB domain-containing protein, partial [Vicinamibacteria bacterium]|nr:translocation/assembly module TamB domain-containing protein [Vicinamibacteria bacterium]
MRAAVGPNSRVGRLHITPGSLSADVEDLIIDGPAYRLEVPRAHLTVSVALVLGRSFAIGAIEADRPHILLGPAPQSGAAGEPLAKGVLIQKVKITNGTLVYHDPALGGDVDLEGIDIGGAVGLGTLNIQVRGGTWRRPKPVPIGPALARVGVSPFLEMKIQSLDAAIAGSRVKASGSLGSAFKPSPNLSAEFHLDLADTAYLEGLPPMSGSLSGAVKVSGRPNSLTAEGHVNGTELTVASWKIDRLQGDVNRGGGDPTRSTARVNLKLLGGEVRGEVDERGSILKGRVDLDNLQIGEMSRDAKGGAPPLTGTITGHITSQGSLEGPLQLNGEVTVAGSDASGLQHRLSIRTSGPVFPQKGTLDVSWETNLESHPEKIDPAVPRLTRARLHASGTARGTLPPKVEGSFDGVVECASARGPEQIPVSGTMRWEKGQTTADLQ